MMWLTRIGFGRVLDAGEAARGPVAATITDAAGVLIRELPLTPKRVKAAIGV
jgi:CO/xanthine dehydrogenase Mo-binding subunit